MAKSLWAIGVIGVGGCVFLSLLLHEALDTHTRMKRNPLAPALERHFGERLVEPARVETEVEDGKSRIFVRLCAIAGLRKERIARTAGRIVWERTRGSDRVPDEVVVAVSDEDDGVVTSVTVPPPRPGR